MAEDTSKVSPPDNVATDKPKRTRKRKTDTDQVSTQAFQVAADMQHSETRPDNATANDIVATAETGDAAPAQVLLMPVEQMTPAARLSGCGGALKAAREAQGLSIHEVSSQLRFGVSQIQAIEQDDFDKLPQQSIVRGFIRNYARLLKIDADPILAAYQDIVPSQAPLPLSVKSSTHTPVIGKPARTVQPQRVLFWVLGLVLVVALAYFYLTHIKPHTLKNAALPLEASTNEDHENQEITLPAAPVAALPESTPLPAEPATTPPGVDAIAQPATTPTAPVADSTSTKVADPVAPASTSLTAAPLMTITTPTPATEGNPGSTTLKALDTKQAHLTFRVNEDSWVRVDDAQGKKVFSEVLTVGAERTISVDKPLSVIVGNASATQLSIDHQPYDLTQATRGRVARIQLK